jgi:hypothetical protein
MRTVLFSVVVLVACGTPPDSGGGGGGGGTDMGSGGGSGGGTDGMGGGGMDMSNHVVDVSSLPCDVAAMLDRDCASCHGAPPTQGASTTILSRSDLLALVPNTMLTVGAASLIYMQTMGGGGMPPSGATQATTGELTAFNAWVQAGMLPGHCDSSPPPMPTCPSGTHWQFGNSGSTVMNPGLACIACHTTMQPREKFTAGGTVFNDLHTEDLCNGGSKSGGKVEIIGADGAVTSLTVNSAGNFYTFNTIKFPYTARVTLNGSVRTMSTPQGVGDCNSCHTVQGTGGAPGRIVWPD